MTSNSVSFAQYFYRFNTDRTIDSICGYCFLTVGTAYTESELRRSEAAHHCVHPLIHSGDLLAPESRGNRKV